MSEKKKLATAGAKDKKITKSGTAELSEEQLDDVSGGLRVTTADSSSSTQKVQKVQKGLHNRLDTCWVVRT